MHAPTRGDSGPPPGTMLGGRWRLVRRLAEGAMGSVHEGVNEVTGQRAALKLLKAELHADPGLRRRFRREASVLQAIEHPGVVRVLELGDDDGAQSYTVMELLVGETLAELLGREPKLPPSVAVPILLGICDALAAVHRHGVIHGDLKPENVFLLAGAASPVKLVDFGLAKVEGLERLTRTGELSGTPVYMPPELFTGQREIDGRLDVYAVGIIAYQSLAGQLPFSTRRHPGALMRDIVLGKVTPLELLAPELPAPLAAAVRRAMAPRRDERTAEAGLLAAELAAAWKERP